MNSMLSSSGTVLGSSDGSSDSKTASPVKRSPRTARVSRTPRVQRAGIQESIDCRLPSTGVIAQVDGYEVVPSIQGNDLAIHRLLQRVLHQPSLAEFSSASSRPGYDPAFRLIVKSLLDRAVVGHVQLQPRSVHLGSSLVRAFVVRDLAIAPECEQRGFRELLLTAAESQARYHGVPLLLAHGGQPRLLRNHGWANLGMDPISIVSPQKLLGQLPAAPLPESLFYADKMPHCDVRLGRLTDLPSLMQLYDVRASQTYGAHARSDEDWTWMAGKRAHNRFYVYSEDGRDLAYVVVRGAGVIELVDQSEQGRAAARLLERVALDAIEQGRHSLRIHGPSAERAHRWCSLASGTMETDSTELGWMVKGTSFQKLLSALTHVFNERKLVRLPTEIGFRVGKEEVLLRQTLRGWSVSRGKAKKHAIETTLGAASQLVLGYRTPQALVEANRLFASSSKAMDALTQLFPSVSLWRGHWDDAAVLDHGALND